VIRDILGARNPGKPTPQHLMGRGGDATAAGGPPLLPRRNSFNATLGSLADVADDMKCLAGMWFSTAHLSSSSSSLSSSSSSHQARLEQFYRGQAAACEF
jgi:hypothetical protein